MYKFFSLRGVVMALVAMTTTILSSCGSVFDDLDPCPQGARLRFVYDYNMEFANAFPSQVDCLTLLVYNAEGKYLTTITAEAPTISDEDWRLTLPLAPGSYRFEAWGGLECENASFRFNATPAELSMDKLNVALKGECMTSPEGTLLHPLFYGALEMTIPEDSEDYTEGTVKMMKDTNNIRILLQNLNGTPSDGEDFTFTITDDNVLLNYDNSIVKGHTYTYNAWTSGQADAGTTINGQTAKLAFAELCTSRLVEGNGARLLITRKQDGKAVVDIPLINYLLLLKSQEFSKMDDQEFLDRESRWDLVFFLNDGVWINTYIKINDWIVRLNNSEF